MTSMLPDGFDSVASVLKHLTHLYELEAKIFEFRLRKFWPNIVGEPIASHSHPDSIKFRKLSVIAENSLWLQELVFLKSVLLERINTWAEVNLVADIIFRVGTIKTKVRPLGPIHSERSSPLSSPEAIAEAAQHTARVQDPDLRASLTKVVAKGLSSLEYPTQTARPSGLNRGQGESRFDNS